MLVLGISETHCATAAVLRDGAVVGCASEERFSRLKNDAGYPRCAIDALLRELDLAPARIAQVVLAGRRSPAHRRPAPAAPAPGSASSTRRRGRPRLPTPGAAGSSPRTSGSTPGAWRSWTTTRATPRRPTSARRSAGGRGPRAPTP